MSTVVIPEQLSVDPRTGRRSRPDAWFSKLEVCQYRVSDLGQSWLARRAAGESCEQIATPSLPVSSVRLFFRMVDSGPLVGRASEPTEEEVLEAGGLVYRTSDVGEVSIFRPSLGRDGGEP